MIKRKLTKSVLVFIVSIQAIALLSACSQRVEPEKPTAWLSIEKPPLKIVYITKVENITDNTANMFLNHAKRFPYKSYPFNEASRVEIDVNAYKSISTEESVTSSVSNSLSVDSGK